MADIGFDNSMAGYGSYHHDDCGGTGFERCARCGCYYNPPTSDYYFVCPVCVEECTTVENVIEFCREDCEEVSVNAAIAGAISVDKINEILAEWCKAHPEECERGIRTYAKQWGGEFNEWIAENK